jgi:hypothetical protein
MDPAYPSTFNQVFGYVVILDHEAARHSTIRRYLATRFSNCLIDSIYTAEEAIQFIVKCPCVPNIVFASDHIISMLESYPLGGRITVQKDKGVYTVTHHASEVRLRVLSSYLDLDDAKHQELVRYAAMGEGGSQ